MIRKNELACGRQAALAKTASALLALIIAAMMILADCALVFADEEAERPAREVHKVAVGDTMYCFFAQHNVVITPEEIAGIESDSELTEEIFKRAGLYMKQTNCKKGSHKAVTYEKWIKDGGGLMLSEEDIASLRSAAPVDGEPVKLQMDVRITEDASDEEAHVYTTYKKTTPRLLFIAVATEADAASGEDLCKEDPPAESKEEKAPSVPSVPSEEEMLPEYKTINMTDRSGEPVGDTLEDGDPVTLEWIEPDKKDAENRSWPLIPCIIAAALSAALIVLIAVRRKRHED